MATFHVTFSLVELIHHGGAASIAGYIRLNGSIEWATEAEIIAHATILKALGYVVLPPCNNHDAHGNCLGH